MKPLFLFTFLFLILIGHAQNYMKVVLYKADGSKADCYIKNPDYEGNVATILNTR